MRQSRQDTATDPRRRGRVVAMLGFTAVLVLAVALVGGLAAAASSSGNAAKSLAKASGKAEGPQAAVNTPAQDQYKPKCNSGRGNLSETGNGSRSTDSDTLINPHTGGQGSGTAPTDDCDPGNSGSNNSGGD